jgi:hypothetical protein
MAKPMYVRFEMPKDLIDKTYQSIELAKEREGPQRDERGHETR